MPEANDASGTCLRCVPSFGYGAVSAAAGGIANAATRSAINGENFGKNLEAALPDIIGQDIGKQAEAANLITVP